MEKQIKLLKKYNAWKCKSNCEPIEGTDRVFESYSKRSVLKHLAFEEGVEYIHNNMIVRLKDGTFWTVSEI